MTTNQFTQLYDEAKSGVVAGLAEGIYDVEVTDARPLAKSRMIWLDLEVQGGPSAGKLAQVSLYIPVPGNRNAGFHFRNKILGFGDLSGTFASMDQAPGLEDGLEILGAALVGRKVQAEIELQSDGDYKGTNQLKSTKPIGEAAAPAPAEAAPVVEDAESSDLPF